MQARFGIISIRPLGRLIVGAVLLLVTINDAVAVVAPEDPSQSIVYWQPHIISDQDPMAIKVKEVFDVLLRSWDDSRIAPGVHVVHSAAGPWAASLADGNILLSQDAVKTCLSFGDSRAQHLLAFVLAHEMAHQRADDLWHQKFFRLIGTQSPEIQKRLMRGIDTQWLNDVEQKEAQADHDALVTMASVGFDPYQVVEKKDFFTTWVEQLWRSSCGSTVANNKDLNNPAQPACEQAKIRALRASTQLETVATQTTVYDLAIESFVAGNYKEARHLFRAYGRDLPSRAVYSGIGLSYLSEALEIKHHTTYLAANSTLPFFYPILLDLTPQATPIESSQPQRKRGVDTLTIEQQKDKIHALLTHAVDNFEKAIKLEPNNRRPYLLIALAYLVDENTFMTRGVLQGQFKRKFGHDNALDLILAMTSAIEGNRNEAIQQLNQLITNMSKQADFDSSLPYHLLQYTAHYNLGILYIAESKPEEAKNLWKELAAETKKKGDSLLFRMALSQLRKNGGTSITLEQYPQIASFRPGDDFVSPASSSEALQSELWIDGEKQVIYRLPASGIRLVVNSNNKISSVWQKSNLKANIGRLSIGDTVDRVHKVLGIPDRELFLQRGIYLAYDHYGVGIHMVNNNIAGWFLYDKN